MADSTIANLTSGSPAQGTDVLPIQRGSSTLKLSVSDVAAAVTVPTLPTLQTPAIFVPGAGVDYNLALNSTNNGNLPKNQVVTFWIFNTPYVLNIKQVAHEFEAVSGTHHVWIGVYSTDNLGNKTLLKSTGSVVLASTQSLTVTPFVVTLQPGTYFLVITSDDVTGVTVANHLQIGSTADVWDDFNVGGHANPGIGASTQVLSGGDLPATIPIGTCSAADIIMPLVVFGI